MKRWKLFITKVFLFFVAAACACLVSGHADCGAQDPTPAEREQMTQNELKVLGKIGNEFTLHELGHVVEQLGSTNRVPSANKDATLHSSGNYLQELDNYVLKSVPIVYHILRNQADAGATDGRPTATDAQLEFTTKITNRLFKIYDKASKTHIQWASFVQDRTIEHDATYNIDCGRLSSWQIFNIVSQASEWQFKLHCIICESNMWSGVASFPTTYSVTHARHNLVRVDYRAVACYDDDGKFLCEPAADGRNVSHTRWWRTRSTVFAHEWGHIFGLQHTHAGGCSDGDGVSDTPASNSARTEGCPGLLPYDKDRDLYDAGSSLVSNPGNETVCGSQQDVCSPNVTCAACCGRTGSDSCQLYTASNDAISVSQAANPSVPQCCPQTTPNDSCLNLPGIDPMNNVMAYTPDWCAHELTPGQMLRMMAQVKAEKDYIFCNYADIFDFGKCSDVPCASTATSPNCVAS